MAGASCRPMLLVKFKLVQLRYGPSNSRLYEQLPPQGEAIVFGFPSVMVLIATPLPNWGN